MTLKYGTALRLWTSNSIGASAKSFQSKQLAAAAFLGKIPNQPFPTLAYRAIVVDTSLGSFKNLKIAIVDRGYPESFASSLNGCKNFVGNALSWNYSKQGVLILAVKVNPSDWLFNVNYLAGLLPQAERRLEDGAGFSLDEYRSQQELVATSGTLYRSFSNKCVSLAGSSAPGGHKLIMLPSLHPINASFVTPRPYSIPTPSSFSPLRTHGDPPRQQVARHANKVLQMTNTFAARAAVSVTAAKDLYYHGGTYSLERD